MGEKEDDDGKVRIELSDERASVRAGDCSNKRSRRCCQVSNVRIPVAEKPVQPTPDQMNVKNRTAEESKAFFGRAVIDVLRTSDGTLKYNIGTYNKRAVQDGAAKKIMRSMDAIGKNDVLSPMIIQVDRDEVEPDSYIGKDGDISKWQDLPLLKFKPRTDGMPTIVEILAGGHRMEACGQWKVKLEKGRDKRQAQVENIETRLGGMGSPEQRAGLEALKETVESETERIEHVGRWCVLLYDRSECARRE